MPRMGLHCSESLIRNLFKGLIIPVLRTREVWILSNGIKVFTSTVALGLAELPKKEIWAQTAIWLLR